MSIQTQWRVGFGGRTGLDNSAVRDTFALLGEQPTPDEFRGIQIMEAAALNTWAREQKS